MSTVTVKLLRTMWGVLDFAKPEPATWEPLFIKASPRLT